MAEKVSMEKLRDLQATCPRGRFRHFRTGNVYVVVGSAISEATLEPLVLYQQEGDARVTFARPLAEWNSVVVYGGGIVKRFKEV